MATKKKAVAARYSKPSFDAKALSNELGATVKEGVVSASKGRFYLKIGKDSLEIPVGSVVTAAAVKKLIGSSIPVIVAAGKIIVIGPTRGPKCYWILCYKPGPGFGSEIDQVVRGMVIDKYVKTGVLPSALGEQMKKIPGSAAAF